MKKRILSLVVVFAMVFTTVAGFAPFVQIVYAQGQTQPIAISTAQQLDNIRNNLDGNFYLTQNIDVSTLGFNWTPIGTWETPFTGTFDGRGFQIINMRIGNVHEKRDEQGLFGVISGAAVRNVTVSGTIAGRQSAGGIAGIATNGSIIDSCANNANIIGQNFVGGIVGSLVNGSVVRQSFNTGDVSASHGTVGGIVGISEGSTVSNAYNIGNITATGYIDESGFNVGGISSGGIAGRLHGSRNTIEFTYNAGNITAVPGGLVESLFHYPTIMLSDAGTGAGGVVGSRVNATSDSVRFNAVLANSILGRDMVIAETITGQQTVIVAGLISGVTQNDALLSVDEQLSRTASNNFAAANILGNAFNDAEETLSRDVFLQQSTWESIGFDFTNIWIMPEGENALPVLRWQTDSFATMLTLSPIQYAQQIFNRLNHSGNILMTGPDLSPAGAQNFLRFTQGIGAERQSEYYSFRSASRIFNFQEHLISASSIALGLIVGGFSPGAAYDLSRMAGLPMPWDDNTDAWVFSEALDGNRMVQDGIRDLARVNLEIRNAGGVFPEYDLIAALDYIYAYYNIQMGMSSLRMGSNHFNNHMNTPPHENLIRIAAGVLPLNFFEPAGEIGEIATGEIIDLLRTGSINNRNTHITNWGIAYADFLESMERFRNYEGLVHRPSGWAAAYVNRAIREGLVPRSLQANYTHPITRAEFAALTVNLYENITGRVITPGTAVSFNDTTDINIRKAASIGVIAGIGNGNFAPNNTITREQAAVMLDRLATAIGRPLLEPHGIGEIFADALQISQWAHDGVQRVNAARIMTGTGGSMFSPQGTFTREQSIIAALRLFERFVTN